MFMFKEEAPAWLEMEEKEFQFFLVFFCLTIITMQVEFKTWLYYWAPIFTPMTVGFAWYYDKVLEKSEDATAKEKEDDVIGGQMFVLTFLQAVVFLSLYLYQRQLSLLDLFLESKENTT